MSALRALRPPVPRLVLFAVTLALASLGCGVSGPRVVIVSPLNGTFTSATAVVVSGLLLEVDTPTSLTGVFRVLGDLDLDGRVDVELRDLAATTAVQIPGFIGGEAVTLEVSAERTANLAAQVGEATPGPAVPGLGPLGGLLLALALCASVRLAESS